MRQMAGTRSPHHVIGHVPRIGATPPEPRPVHPYSWVLDEWTAFLRQHRGLAPASGDVYRRAVEPFLQELEADATPERLVALTAERVHAYRRQPLVTALLARPVRDPKAQYSPPATRAKTCARRQITGEIQGRR
jgi:hypothetical protein